MNTSKSRPALERLAIVGPGAMGLLHAIRLAQGGVPVALLDHRKGRARRLSEGLVLRVPIEGDFLGETIRVQIPCFAARTEKTPYDLLIFTVKAFSTAEAASGVSHLIGPETALMSLQNGLGNVEALQECQRLELILAGVTTSGATLYEENTVIQRGLGTISVGSVAGNHELARKVADLFSGAGLPAEALADIRPTIWRKLAVNCAINPLTAILDVENGLLLEAPVTGLAGEVARETGEVARAVGVDLDPSGLPETVAEVCRLTADNVSSMRQDFRAGRQTEIDQLNGAVVREAEKVGMRAPLNMALTALLKAHEWRREYEWQERERKREARREHRRRMSGELQQESDE